MQSKLTVGLYVEWLAINSLQKRHHVACEILPLIFMDVDCAGKVDSQLAIEILQVEIVLAHDIKEFELASEGNLASLTSLLCFPS